MPDGQVQDAGQALPFAAGADEGGCRGSEILSLARQAFVEKGFDGASMRDLARAAGMCAGNFYRYFPSKDALIEAMIARDCADIEEQFQTIVASQDPMSSLKASLRRHVFEDDHENDELWAEIAAAAARKPSVAAAVRRMEDAIVGRIADVLVHVHGAPDGAALRRFDAHARLIFMIVHAAMSTGHARSLDPGVTTLMLTTLDRLLDEAVGRPVPEDA